jgi:hypothetical protein
MEWRSNLSELRLVPVPAIFWTLKADLLSRRIGALRTKVRLVSFAEPKERGLPQANRVTLTRSRRRHNSFKDDFEHQFRLAGVVKLLAGSLESFTHRRNRLGFEKFRFYE